MTFSAVFRPSTAEDMIQHNRHLPMGYKPAMLARWLSSLLMRTGEELLVSTPVRILSGMAKPLILRPKYTSASRSVSMT